MLSQIIYDHLLANCRQRFQRAAACTDAPPPIHSAMSHAIPEVEFLAVHPGWVATDMGGSGGRKADISAEESAAGVVREALRQEKRSGVLVDWRGNTLPWWGVERPTPKRTRGRATGWAGRSPVLFVVVDRSDCFRYGVLGSCSMMLGKMSIFLVCALYSQRSLLVIRVVTGKFWFCIMLIKSTPAQVASQISAFAPGTFVASGSLQSGKWEVMYVLVWDNKYAVVGLVKSGKLNRGKFTCSSAVSAIWTRDFSTLRIFSKLCLLSNFAAVWTLYGKFRNAQQIMFIIRLLSQPHCRHYLMECVPIYLGSGTTRCDHITDAQTYLEPKYGAVNSFVHDCDLCMWKAWAAVSLPKSTRYTALWRPSGEGRVRNALVIA